MKIHYTLYDNFTERNFTSPYCNDNARFPQESLTKTYNEVTCKNCLKSLISTKKLLLEITYSHSLLNEKWRQDLIKKEVSNLFERLEEV